MIKILTTILALAISGAVFFVYTQPAYSSVKELQSGVDEYNAALDKAREFQDLKRSLLARYNTFGQDQLTRLSHLLPDHVDNVRLVLDLDRMATRYGMAVQNVAISRPQVSDNEITVIGAIGGQKQKYDSLTLQFSTRGTYDNFVRFIENLESSLRIVELESFSVEPEQQQLKEGEPQTNSDDILYRYNITLRTYWLK
jgi:Tfp pilus assembly protein PilO